MTATTLAARPSGASTGKPRRWCGVAFGLLLGLAAVCHGCHVGDHDDELSVHSGTPHVEKGSDAPASRERERPE